MSEPLFTIEQVITMLYDLPVLVSLSKEQVIELLETGAVIL